METRDRACLVGCVNKVFMQTLAVNVEGHLCRGDNSNNGVGAK